MNSFITSTDINIAFCIIVLFAAEFIEHHHSHRYPFISISLAGSVFSTRFLLPQFDGINWKNRKHKHKPNQQIMQTKTMTTSVVNTWNSTAKDRGRSSSTDFETPNKTNSGCPLPTTSNTVGNDKMTRPGCDFRQVNGRKYSAKPQ